MIRFGGQTLRGRLTRSLVGLGIVSVALLAAVNFMVVRGLLSSSTEQQLQSVRDVRTDEVNLAFNRLLERTAVFGLDPSVADALIDLSNAYVELDDDSTAELNEAQLDELRAVYEPVVARYDAAGADRPPIDELLPDSIAGRYVQYEYVAQNRADPRSDLVDAGDGTAYSAAHAEHHEFLSEMAASIGASDLLLVSGRNLDAVYSVSKEVDLGTDVVDGPYSDIGLGAAVTKLLEVSVDDAVMTDMQFYLPNSSAPVLHVAVSVRSGTQLVGALVLRLEISRVTDLVTQNGDWELLGLGDTGDAYIVGTDARLRTLTRSFLDDPNGYVERYGDVSGDERTAELMKFTGSPVLFAKVDNSAVVDALGGDPTFGRAKNSLGDGVLVAAAPISAGGLGWVLVTEQATSESRSELVSFVWSILLLLGALAIVLLVVGSLLARRIAKPVKPLVEAATDIAAGEYDTVVPDLGRNELGDVGQQLSAVAARLREQEESIRSEEQRISTMLASVLPEALVERVRRGERELAESVDGATVVSIVVRGVPVPSAAEQDALVELMARMNEAMSHLATTHGVERVKVALERQLFVAGRGTAAVGTDEACAFALAALDLIPEVAAEQGLTVDARAGIATGLVASGVIGSRQVSFDVWGEAVSSAVALARDAEPGTVVADEAVLDGAERGWSYAPWGDRDRVVVMTSPSTSGDRA